MDRSGGTHRTQMEASVGIRLAGYGPPHWGSAPLTLPGPPSAVRLTPPPEGTPTTRYPNRGEPPLSGWAASASHRVCAPSISRLVVRGAPGLRGSTEGSRQVTRSAAGMRTLGAGWQRTACRTSQAGCRRAGSQARNGGSSAGLTRWGSVPGARPARPGGRCGQTWRRCPCRGAASRPGSAQSRSGGPAAV